METFSLFTILAIVVQKVVEWIRSKFPQVDSDYVRLAAVAVGTAMSWAAGINVEEVLREYGLTITDIPEWLSYLGSGAAIGFGAGAIADLLNRSGPNLEYQEELTVTSQTPGGGETKRQVTGTVTEHHAEQVEVTRDGGHNPYGVGADEPHYGVGSGGKHIQPPPPGAD